MIKVDWVDVLCNPQSSTIIDSPKTYKPDGKYLSNLTSRNTKS